MARSDLLLKLFTSYSRGDDTEFHSLAREIIADERRKNHRLLASELEHALARTADPVGSRPLTLRPIPKGRDERPLLRLAKPDHELDDLVLDESRREVLRDVVMENLSRATLTSNALRPRQRLLLLGPSGTGKTASAHAIAAELSLPVATASLAGLTSSFLGETARNIEAVIGFAEQVPCVLLFDEFDVLGQERGQSGDHGEMRRVVATVLQLLEDFRGESLVVATSNHPQRVDAAIWRRFDELIVFDLLEQEQLGELVALKLRSIRTAISIPQWSRRLRGRTPAEVELVCLNAMRRTLLTGGQVVDDDAMGAALARMEARATAMSKLAHGESTSHPTHK